VQIIPDKLYVSLVPTICSTGECMQVHVSSHKHNEADVQFHKRTVPGRFISQESGLSESFSSMLCLLQVPKVCYNT
jgi:hypothetical protein